MILNDLNLSSEQFVDLCILLGGMEGCPTCPLFCEPIMPFNFNMIYESLKQVGSALQFFAFNSGHPILMTTNYVELFSRARAIIKSSPIIKENGVVEPSKPNNSFSDLFMIFGEKFSDYCYFLFSNNIISAQV